MTVKLLTATLLTAKLNLMPLRHDAHDGHDGHDGNGHLASTGGPSLLIGLGALLLLGAGSVTLVVSRRRRRS